MSNHMLCETCRAPVLLDKHAVRCTHCAAETPLNAAIIALASMAEDQDATLDPGSIAADDQGRLTFDLIAKRKRRRHRLVKRGNVA